MVTSKTHTQTQATNQHNIFTMPLNIITNNIHATQLISVAISISQLVFMVKPMSVVVLRELLIVLSVSFDSMIYVTLLSADDYYQNRNQIQFAYNQSMVHGTFENHLSFHLKLSTTILRLRSTWFPLPVIYQMSLLTFTSYTAEPLVHERCVLDNRHLCAQSAIFAQIKAN